VIAIPAAHPLARKDTVTFADLSGEPLVMFAPSADPDLYRELNAHFSAAGATMNVVLETGHVLSGINFVSMGIGCCILGGYLRRVAWNGVVYKRLDAVGFTKTLAVVKATRSPRPVGVFFDFIRTSADGPDVRPYLHNRWDEEDPVVVLPPVG
jgi:DNA-binding transcriptional LysR family regulator